MFRSLSTSASGMRAQQIYVDTVANNLANVNTTGFKSSRAEFQDLLYQVIKPNQSLEAGAGVQPVQIGHGVKLAAVRRNFTQGSTIVTGNALDLAISGDGFFRVELADGTFAYTRDGTFAMDGEGNLVNGAGLRVAPGLSFPEGTTEVAVDRQGNVRVRAEGEDESRESGQIEVYRFANPAGMRSLGNNLYAETEASGDPQQGEAGTNGYGEIEAGILEASNVSVVEEMIRLIEAQRAYELNSKAIQTAEDMLSVANQLKR
ncbi:MAG: flagellar basal-body rod protein FlgG [Candidatus Krumholzibacteriota bacterium]|nr:flagellar basal-body rod protein FlgG [Candidatus Krumholzibacteriota bacterium]